MLRFMSICQQSCDPEMYQSFIDLCRRLIDNRDDLRAGCFERIEAYLHGSANRWPVHG